MPINYKAQKIIASAIIFILVVGAVFLIKDIKYIQDLKNVMHYDTEESVETRDVASEDGHTLSTADTTINTLTSDAVPVAEYDVSEVVTLDSVPEDGYNISNFGDQFIYLLNEYRVVQGKSAVTKRDGLVGVAQVHTDWMQTNETLGHEGENNSKFTDRCKLAGITCAAENVAYGFLSPEHLLELWQNSPLHNENLLGNYATVGLGSTDTYATLLLDF